MIWQEYLNNLGESKLEFGLERVNIVFAIIQKKINYQPQIITVGGTNGKGSTCAFINSLLMAQKLKVGLFTSPHLFSFCERIRVNNININDDELNQCLTIIEEERSTINIQLTYFEVSLLIAWIYFAQKKCQILIMEVGLGGRLDAVNVLNADVAVLTTIDLDHTQYLGNTRELIATEKLAIARAEKYLVCGDINPPKTVADFASNNKIKLLQINKNFGFELNKNNTWNYWRSFGCENINIIDLAKPSLVGGVQIQNCALAITAVDCLVKNLSQNIGINKISKSIVNTQIKARFEIVEFKGREIIFDICHNPQAGRNLALNLNNYLAEKKSVNNSKIWAVFSALQDKDARKTLEPLVNIFDGWFIAGIVDNPRGQTAEALFSKIENIFPKGKKITKSINPEIALSQALTNGALGDRIVVFGSFVLVAKCYEQINKL